jgi:glycosyltransferase involved in cell wall biosynthesis
MLYQGLHGSSLLPVRAYDLDTTLRIARDLRGSAQVVAHLHWLNVVMARTSTRLEAETRLRAYVAKLDQLRDLGAEILWTVHNVVPHESAWPDLEVELRTEVVARAGRVHAMSTRTRELCAPHFDIPEDKLFFVPHPSYDGVYPGWMSREEARAELGISGRATVFLTFGRLAPYKGSPELFDAFTRLAVERPGEVVLLVAGRIGPDAETQAFLRHAAAHTEVLIAPGEASAEDVMRYFTAADVCVYPYRRSLNSGALALGLTYGRPAVLPEHSGEAERGQGGWAVTYDSDDPDGLLAALREACDRLTTPEARSAARAAVTPLSPAATSARFHDEVRRWIDGRRTAGSEVS